MNAEKIYLALNHIDDELLERYIKKADQKEKRTILIKSGAIAACLCVIAAGILALYAHFGNNINSPVASDGTSLITTKAKDDPDDSKQLYKEEGTVVASFGAQSSTSYAAPKNGSWFYYVEVADALEKYAEKDVTYFLAIDIFSDTSALDVKNKELAAELERLSALGYHVGYAKAWTYQGEGEKVPYSYAAGYFSAEQLKSFAANARYGYAFHFAVNGDGSPVSSSQGIVCDFE